MKCYLTKDKDTSLRKTKIPNLSYKVTDHSIELEHLAPKQNTNVELKILFDRGFDPLNNLAVMAEDEESYTKQYVYNLYLWGKNKDVIEFRVCLNNILDFLRLIKPDKMIDYYELYPQLYDKLVRNRNFGAKSDGLIKQAKDYDDKQRKWFLVYEYEWFRSFNLKNVNQLIQNSDIQEYISEVIKETNKFLKDLDPGRVSVPQQIKRGFYKGLEQLVWKWGSKLAAEQIADIIYGDVDFDASGSSTSFNSGFEYIRKTHEVPEIFRTFVERSYK